MTLVPLVLLAPVLLAVIWSDLRYMRIPDELSLVTIAIFIGVCLVAPPVDFWFRLLAALAVLSLGFAGFCVGLWGGGDVKFLAVLMLFVPIPTLAVFNYLFAASMLVGVGLVLALRRIPALAGHRWKSIAAKGRYPMGLSIGLAGLLHPAVVALLSVPAPV